MKNLFSNVTTGIVAALGLGIFAIAIFFMGSFLLHMYYKYLTEEHEMPYDIFVAQTVWMPRLMFVAILLVMLILLTLGAKLVHGVAKCMLNWP